MYVGITVQNINNPNYSEKGHYLNVRWQDFAEASGFTLIPLTSISLADQMIREKLYTSNNSIWWRKFI